MTKTYNEIYIDIWHKLRDAGVEGNTLEARLLVAAAAGKTQKELLRDMKLYSAEGVAERAEELARRMLAGEPAAYLTGRWGFYGLEFIVTRDVLIPRMDTEVLVEASIAALGSRSADVRILDLCTGSGCVGCALAEQVPSSRVVLMDNSPPALRVAEENVRALSLSSRVDILLADLRNAPPAGLGSFDLVVANPPYVPSAELPLLDPSVRDYEPASALDGGPDGLSCYRFLLENWLAVLRPSGHLLLEVGEDQAGAVTLLLRRAGLRHIETVRDTQNYERVVRARK